MKIKKLVSVGALVLGISFHAAAEEDAPLFSPNGEIVGLVQSDTGHVYNRDHTLPGDPGFDDNVYEFRVTAANILPRNVVTAWLFCLDANQRRIGGLVNAQNQIMGGRLDATIGAPILEDKVHVGFSCGLPIKSPDGEGPDAEDVAFAEIVLVDHGRPVRRTNYFNADGEKVEGVMLQLMNRPEDDPFCNGTYKPRRNCKTIGSGIVPLHRHHVHGDKE